jgi:hypothetical protein
MAKIEDKHRTFMVAGRPIATGVLALSDAWACTNPSLGRGMSIGVVHAAALRDVLHDSPPDHFATARAWHDTTMVTVEPWYRTTLTFDSGRLAEIDAQIAGEHFDPDPGYEAALAMQCAAGKDPELLRAMVKVFSVLELPERALADPELADRVGELGRGWRDETLPGPNREELLALVG